MRERQLMASQAGPSSTAAGYADADDDDEGFEGELPEPPFPEPVPEVAMLADLLEQAAEMEAALMVQEGRGMSCTGLVVRFLAS